jgi:hypothetical protein
MERHQVEAKAEEQRKMEKGRKRLSTEKKDNAQER